MNTAENKFSMTRASQMNTEISKASVRIHKNYQNQPDINSAGFVINCQQMAFRVGYFSSYNTF